MGIITMVKNIKQIHDKEVLFIKIGKFYYCYGRDSYIISYFFDYKLNFVENTYSCGFPSQSLSKVLSKLESCKISYLIADRKDNYEIDTHENFKNLNNYEKYYKKAKEEIGLKIRIEKIRKYLLKTMDSRILWNKVKANWDMDGMVYYIVKENYPYEIKLMKIW